MMMMMKVDYLEYHEIAINNSGIYKIEIRKNSGPLAWLKKFIKKWYDPLKYSKNCQRHSALFV